MTHAPTEGPPSQRYAQPCGRQIKLVPASPAHFGRIATRMRAMDRVECAAFGLTPKRAMRTSWLGSTYAMTAFVGDRPEAMFGVTPISAIEGRGSPWFLGTDVVALCARSLVELGPVLVARMHTFFSTLENQVARENRLAIRMLRRWGFKVGEEAKLVGGVEFLKFERNVGVNVGVEPWSALQDGCFQQHNAAA